MSEAVKRHNQLNVELTCLRMDRARNEDGPDENSILDEMEAIWNRSTDSEREEMELPIHVTKDQVYQLNVMVGVNVEGWDRVVASKDDEYGRFRKGQLAYTQSPMRMFMPLPFIFEGQPVYKCWDVDPDSTFWVPEK